MNNITHHYHLRSSVKLMLAVTLLYIVKLHVSGEGTLLFLGAPLLKEIFIQHCMTGFEPRLFSVGCHLTYQICQVVLLDKHKCNGMYWTCLNDLHIGIKWTPRGVVPRLLLGLLVLQCRVHLEDQHKQACIHSLNVTTGSPQARISMPEHAHTHAQTGDRF